MALAALICREQAVEQLLVRGVGFVEHARVNGSGQQIVGGSNGMNVTGKVQVELFHGHNLRITAAGGPALDAKSRPL